MLSHARHRQRRQHPAPPHVLRDARQLLDRRLLQGARRSRFAWELSLEVLRFRGGRHLGDGVRGRRAARARARRGGDRAVAGRRRAARADRALCPRSENFWEAGPVGPERALLGALHRPRPLLRRATEDLPGGENERFLEYWNLVFMQYDQDPHDQPAAAAGPQHRHRPRPQPPGGDPPGHRLGVRDRPVPAADRPRPRALRAHARTRRRGGPVPIARCASSPTTRAGCRF